jgi:hypothetical protein
MSFIIYELEVVDGDLIIAERFAWKLKFEKLDIVVSDFCSHTYH